ncbi:MAG: hypothetical protein AB1696_01340 [Planctomycetota bacterium]
MPPKVDESRQQGISPRDKAEVEFGSNDIRLTGYNWIFVFVVVALVFCLAPSLWHRAEGPPIGPDYRLPYSLGNDYWLYEQWCRRACDEGKALVIGDSVVWGHYVASDRTISHFLNEIAGEARFANLGVDGIHPAALSGLIRYYGRAISGGKVLLHCNPLWMTSDKHDLQTKKEFTFNHPRLVPQFFPRIPCYREPYAQRLGIAIGRNAPFFGWTNHLRVAYFDNNDIPRWTIEHPYANPLRCVTFHLPGPDDPVSTEPIETIAKPWKDKGIPEFSPAWVGLDTSFQWYSFRATVDLLKRRGNDVFVLVGPFNEHMLTEASLTTYNQMKKGIVAWLQERQVPHDAPLALPSDLYADASHPLAEGYALLARQLFEKPEFLRFAGGKEATQR